MLYEAFWGGVHETLVILHEEGVSPFDTAYEGTPFHDFVGRLDDWVSHPGDLGGRVTWRRSAPGW